MSPLAAVMLLVIASMIASATVVAFAAMGGARKPTPWIASLRECAANEVEGMRSRPPIGKADDSSDNAAPECERGEK